MTSPAALLTSSQAAVSALRRSFSASLLILSHRQHHSWSPLTVRCLNSAASASVPAAAASSGSVEHQQQQQPKLSGDAHQRYRLSVFNAEFDRQRRRAARSIDKIEVTHTGLDGQAHSLFLNRGISTPLDAAKHLSEELATESVLATVDGAPWDMHRPLVAGCSLGFLNFKTPGSREEAEGIKLCNTALWRSGSLLLGAVFEAAFKDAYDVQLISFPPPYIKSGSFIYDCQVSRQGRPLAWTPGHSELRALSLAAEKLLATDPVFQPMDAPGPVAMEMFRHNECKLAAVKNILETRPDSQSVTVYRVGAFVDLSSGPMISRAGLIGRFAFAGVHQISAPDFGPLLRVQGLAIPRAFLAHFTSVELLQRRAAVLNRSFLPTRPGAARRPRVAAGRDGEDSAATEAAAQSQRKRDV